MNIKYFLYARKSTEDEERQVMSIEAQLVELKEYAKRERIEIDKEFIESKSAKTPGREAFNEMIKKIKESKEPIGILAWHPDRLARNSIDGGQIIYLIDTGKIASLRFPTFWFEPTPQGLFMLQVAFGQSKYYSDNLSENVKRGRRQKIRRGEWPGLAPIGYINNQKTRNIEPDPIKVRVIKKAFEEFATGKHTLKSLGKRMQFLGVESKTHKSLCKATLQRMLTNPVYLGLIVHNGEIYEGRFQSIISKELFDKVQQVLKQRAKPRKSKRQHYFPFRRLLRCGECGGAITAQFAHGNGGIYRYYRCSKKLGKCSQPYLREDLMAQQLKKIISSLMLPETWLFNMKKQLEKWKEETTQNIIEILSKIETKQNIFQQKLDKLVSLYLDGLLDKETYQTKREELIKQKISLEERKKKLRKEKVACWLEPLEDFVNTLFQAKKLAQSDNLEEIKQFFEKIGTNHRLLDKKVIFSLKKPFNLISKYKEIWLSRRVSARRAELKNERCLIVSEFLNEARTYFEENFTNS